MGEGLVQPGGEAVEEHDGGRQELEDAEEPEAGPEADGDEEGLEGLAELRVAARRRGVEEGLVLRGELPDLLRVGVVGGGDGGHRPDDLGKDDRAEDDERDEDQLGLPDRGELRAGEFRLAVEDGVDAVVVDREGEEPAGDALVAREDHAGLADERDGEGLADHAFEAGGHVADDGRVDEGVDHQHRHHAPVPPDEHAADGEIEEDARGVHQADDGEGDIAASLGRGEHLRGPLPAELAQGAQAAEYRAEADDRDGQRDAEAEAEVEIERVLEDRLDRAVAGGPGDEDVVPVEEGVQDPGDHEPREGADDGPERHDHADHECAEVEREPRGDGGEKGLGLARPVSERDGEHRDRGVKQGGTKRGQAHVKQAKEQPDRAADGEYPPPPGLAGIALIEVLREGGDALGADGRHREGKSLDVRGEAEEPETQDRVVEARDDLLEDNQADHGQPRRLEEVALGEHARVVRGEPRRDHLGHALADHCVALDKKLAVEKTFERGGHHRARHVEEGKDLGLSEVLVRALGDLHKKNDGHPLGGRADPEAGEEVHVDRARHHEDADEHRPDDGGPGEAFFKGPRRRHDLTVTFEFLVDLLRHLSER